MAVSAAVKTWATNEKLTSSDLNAEFTNVYNNSTVAGGIVAEQLDLTDNYAWTGLHTFNNANTLFGHTSALTTDATNQVQVLGTAAADSSALVGRFSADASGGAINFLKSRHASLGSNTIVQDNDVLGGMYFYGADGGDFATPGASVLARVNGTPGANDLPTELVFSTTADGANSTTERLRISTAGLVEVVGGLDVGGDADIDGTTNLDAVDIDGAVQIDGTITVGATTDGYDVKFFGNAAGAYVEWDESEDQLRIMGASADATTSTGKLLLATSLTDINANDVLGKIDFQAPHEATGTDAITIAASIQAVAQATFTATVNSTDLLFLTGDSEAATEKFRITSQGELGVGGANYGTDGQVLTSTGAGTAPAWEDAGSSGASLSGSTDDTIATVTGSNALQGEANLKFSSGQVMTVSSGSASLPQVLVENTANDATSSVIKFNVNKGAAGADNDDLGRIEFWGYDDAPAAHQFGSILGEIADASHNDECGKLSLSVAENDGTITTGLALTGSTTDGEVDVTIGAGVDSVTEISGVIKAAAMPCFSVMLNSTQSDVTGDATIYTIPFNYERFDQGGDFTNAGGGTPVQGTFTAPVNGRYFLNTLCQLGDNTTDHDEAAIQIVTSNTSYYVHVGSPTVSGFHGGSAIVDMDVGDIANVKLDFRGDTKTVDANAGCYFQGYLLCGF